MFTQQKTKKKIHVTSNPLFAFHDDVFPGFAKNAASQPRFPRPSFYYKTIIPDNYFSSLEELKHISTVELKLNGTETFQFEIDFEDYSKERTIFELNFFDEKNFISVGINKNGSLWMDSAYFKEIFGATMSSNVVSEKNREKKTKISHSRNRTEFPVLIENGEIMLQNRFFYSILISQ